MTTPSGAEQANTEQIGTERIGTERIGTEQNDASANALPNTAFDTLKSWEQFTTKRANVAATLSKISQRIAAAELTGAEESGQLSLSRSIHEIQQAANTLNEGTYRLMVMGDMKRGKSTLLNALIGENVLPSDVNPCTALLTTLRYGPEKRVTLHFKDDARSPETIDLESFKANYTIDPTESKRLEAQSQEAFPHISRVVVEYPLPLLQQGIELIDTPGLNDTEARNEQVLSYLSDCQAVLFVLNATQPFTLDEHRYLNNYLKDAGLALFFVINGWDRIQSELVNPEDTAAVAAAEEKVRAVFATNLQAYCASASELRIFEVSALKALRQRLKGESLQGSGLPNLLTALDHFLAHERGPAELRRALSVANRAYRSVSTSVTRRIPLLDANLEELQAKVASVQSDFGQLESIRDRYRQVVRTSSKLTAKTVSNSFRDFILGLEKTFEKDFAASQPDLEFLDFLEAEKRQEFHRDFKRAFERYINDRLATWEFTAKQSIGTAFDALNSSAVDYQVEYGEVVDVIQQKIMGNRFYAVGASQDPSDANIWADTVKDVFTDVSYNFEKTLRSFNQFWYSVFHVAMVSVCATILLQVIGLIFTGVFLNIIGIIAAAGGVFALQAEFVRQEFLKATKKEFIKQLPKIADEQTPNIYRAVEDCFQAYEEQSIERISSDISSRKNELNNLVQQKQTHEINREQEIERLQQLEKQVKETVSSIESMIGAEG